MKYREQKDQKSLELEMLDLWEEKGIFGKVTEKTRDKKPFVFYEGPPTANGRPGVHHIMARTVKDIVCRYKTMQGHFVDRKGGWDTHGLPVELEVEKKLGLESKKDIEEYGIDKFNKACRDSVFTYLKEWEEVTRRIGYWLDLDNPYVTCTNDYIESIWWLLSEYHRKGMIYEGHKIVPYCPRCGTALSDHEVAQGRKDVKDPSIYIRFRIKDRENAFFLVWTTTPWTLLSNVALALHPDFDYVEIEEENGNRLILHHQRALALFGEDVEILKKYKGKDLKGIDYEPLFNFVTPEKRAWFTINADYVTDQDGTGVVHIAPAFGAEDYQEGQKNDLPLIQLVTSEGKIPQEATPFAGKFIKDADPDIITDLKHRGLLWKSGKIEHNYPFCWRCKSPLINYARSSWYIRTTSYKDTMIEQNKKIDWYPPAIGHGRLGQWLENNIDWAISRERYWGTPLPIWLCNDCDHQHAIGSIAELKEKAVNLPEGDLDLHRPYVDDIEIKCEKCGGTMHRTPEVIDCWFDSGGMPFAQSHYPFEDNERFNRELFPADFISEGVDQTRGWFYTLQAISAFIKGQSPYKQCLVIGLVLDEKGRKMSKSLGNALAPSDFFDKWGADPLRWFLIQNSQPWLPTKISLDNVGEVSSKVFDTFKNVYSFFVTYANIDGYDPKEEGEKAFSVLDRWILSRMETLKKNVYEMMEGYDMTRATREIGSFILDEVSNWYVRRSRRRFWGSDMSPDKRAAYSTLRHVMLETAKLMAPFAPMTADFYYLALNGGQDSVHLEDLPEVVDDHIDKKLEEDMDYVLGIANAGRSVRAKAKIRIRQPLRTLYVMGARELPEEIMALLLDELNIKEVKEATESFTVLTAKPNFRTLGRKLGKDIQKGKEIILGLTPDVLANIEKGESIEIDIDGTKYELLPEDIELENEDDPSYISVTDNDMTVAISKDIDEEMLREGLARELVNRIQNTRKNADFEVSDRIALAIFAPQAIMEAARVLENYITKETLTDSLTFGEEIDHEYKEDWDIDGQKVTLYVKRA